MHIPAFGCSQYRTWQSGAWLYSALANVLAGERGPISLVAAVFPGLIGGGKRAAE